MVDHHNPRQITSSGHIDHQKHSQKKNFFMNSLILVNNVKEPFRVITTTILSLLLPLSFLLLARLSSARFRLSLSQQDPLSSTNFFSIFLYTNPALLYSLVSTISVSTLIHNLTGNKRTLSSPSSSSSDNHLDHDPQNNFRRSRLYASWVFLCTLQVGVWLGIEESIAFGTDYSFSSEKRTVFSRVIFLLGLHETMLHWSVLAVSPVVNDTILGVVSSTEKWIQRGVMAGGFGSLWYWRMRDEVESLVVVAEVKREMSMAVGLADFAGWWLYYLTITVGMVRVVKGIMWVGMSLFCRRRLILISDHGEEKV